MNYRFSKTSQLRLIGVATPLVKLMYEALKESPHDFKIAEGVRTAERQNKLYRNLKEKGVWLTDKDGYIKKSKHQLGLAVDIVPVIAGIENWEDYGAFKAIGRHIEVVATKMNINIRWGGRWKKEDLPHIELI